MKKIHINGFEFYFDGNRSVFTDKDMLNGKTDIYSNHVTNNERQQILNNIRY
jgi:hypothetical protein